MEFAMEKREKQLYAASVIGDVESLSELLKEDKSVLDNYGTSTELCSKTPLHIAASHGHVEFAKVLLQNKPGLVNELDSRLCSPLHLAAANGRKEMVKLLLSVDSDACLIEDEFGRTPLHLAATTKGKVEVVNELVTARPEAFIYLMNQTKTVATLHMYVIRNGPKAIEQLVDVDHKILNYQDGEGNTILHKVVDLKQLETLEYLVRRKELVVGLKNRDNLTVFDIIKRMQKDSDTAKMKKLLKNARNTATSSQENDTTNMQSWVETKKNALLVCATVVASIAYQAALNPPGGVWDDDKDDYPTFEHKNIHVIAGTSMMAINFPLDYFLFLGCNTSSFIGALCLVLLLTSSPPQFGNMRVRRMLQKAYMWLLTFITWVIAATLSIAYILGIIGTMPTELMESMHQYEVILTIPVYIFFSWFLFIAIILLVIICRLLFFIGKTLVKYIKRARRTAQWR